MEATFTPSVILLSHQTVKTVPVCSVVSHMKSHCKVVDDIEVSNDMKQCFILSFKINLMT
jgi:hypothetical protein